MPVPPHPANKNIYNLCADLPLVNLNRDFQAVVLTGKESYPHCPNLLQFTHHPQVFIYETSHSSDG